MRQHDTMTADLTDIARPRDTTHTRHAGHAWWDGATGEYILTIGRGSRTSGWQGGPTGAVAMLDSIERHGMRADGWQWNDATGRLTCDLWERDWTLAGAR
jgi:hypothetical protein